MRIRCITVWRLLLTVTSLIPSLAVGKPIKLDRYPVCEASAAITVPCADDPQASCIWVGDNEHEDKVFEYTANTKGKLTPTQRFEIPLGDAAVGDIEALVQDETGLLVIGSHSRKRDCTKDAKRDRVAVARIQRDPLRAELVASGQGWEDHITKCESTWIPLADVQPGARTSRQRERHMQRFKSPGKAQRFLSAYGPIVQHFRPRRHRFAATTYRHELRKRFQIWQEITVTAIAA